MKFTTTFFSLALLGFMTACGGGGGNGQNLFDLNFEPAEGEAAVAITEDSVFGYWEDLGFPVETRMKIEKDRLTLATNCTVKLDLDREEEEGKENKDEFAQVSASVQLTETEELGENIYSFEFLSEAPATRLFDGAPCGMTIPNGTIIRAYAQGGFLSLCLGKDCTDFSAEYRKLSDL